MMLFSELSDLIQRNRLLLFLGSDLPMALTGLPNRTELARRLAQRKQIENGLTLAEVTQRTMSNGNRWEFTDFLGRQLDTAGKHPTQFHHLVSRLPIQTIITTSYDNLLEKALQQLHRPVNRLVRSSDLPFTDPSHLTVIKLYGDLSQRDSLVVTEDDHYGLWTNVDKANLLDEVRTLLRKNTVLLLGYNLADADFNLLWHEVLARAGRFPMGAYAIDPEMPQSARHVWAERRIRIIDQKPLEFLEKLVVMQKDWISSAVTPKLQSVNPATSANSEAQNQVSDVEEEIHHLKSLRREHQRRLRVLQKQEAQSGTHTDPKIITEIEDILKTINHIDKQLGRLNDGAS